MQSVHNKIHAAFNMVRVHEEIDIELATDSDEVELIELGTEVNVGLTMQECLLRVEQSTALATGQSESCGVYYIDEVREDVTTLYAKCLAALSEG